MRRQYGDDGSGMSIAKNAMTMAEGLGGLMRQGQQLEAARRALADDAGVRQAYEYIAQRVGQQGDISALDGDPVMNTRYGIMATGKFMADRAHSEQSRLAMLNNMAQADGMLYQNTIRPLMATAQDAYNRRDMRSFGQAVNALSAVFPAPYQYQMGADGNFDEYFRSSRAGRFVPTGERATPQQAMEFIKAMAGGEQQVLAGADMRVHTVNPRFLAMSARYRMGTMLDNANNLATPSKWIPLEKNGRVIYAIPQNRHDDYSATPSYRVLDESSGTSTMVASMDELLQQGYVPSAVKANTRVLQKKGRPDGGAVATAGPDGSLRIPQAQYEKMAKEADRYAVFEDPVTGEKSTSPTMRSGLMALAVSGGYGTVDNAMMAVERTESALVSQYPDKMKDLSPRQRQETAMVYLLRGTQQRTPAQQGDPSAGSQDASPRNDPLSASIDRNTGRSAGREVRMPLSSAPGAAEGIGGTAVAEEEYPDWDNMTPEEYARYREAELAEFKSRLQKFLRFGKGTGQLRPEDYSR